LQLGRQDEKMIILRGVAWLQIATHDMTVLAGKIDICIGVTNHKRIVSYNPFVILWIGSQVISCEIHLIKKRKLSRDLPPNVKPVTW
jgi:hypothetical protein